MVARALKTSYLLSAVGANPHSLLGLEASTVKTNPLAWLTQTETLSQFLPLLVDLSVFTLVGYAVTNNAWLPWQTMPDCHKKIYIKKIKFGKGVALGKGWFICNPDWMSV